MKSFRIIDADRYVQAARDVAAVLQGETPASVVNPEALQV